MPRAPRPRLQLGRERERDVAHLLPERSLELAHRRLRPPLPLRARVQQRSPGRSHTAPSPLRRATWHPVATVRRRSDEHFGVRPRARRSWGDPRATTSQRAASLVACLAFYRRGPCLQPVGDPRPIGPAPRERSHPEFHVKQRPATGRGSHSASDPAPQSRSPAVPRAPIAAKPWGRDSAESALAARPRSTTTRGAPKPSPSRTSGPFTPAPRSSPEPLGLNTPRPLRLLGRTNRIPLCRAHLDAPPPGLSPSVSRETPPTTPPAPERSHLPPRTRPRPTPRFT
ncbi:Hypothetical protein I5071_71370 [Sandaracinus amylolyticus]|nr:Hypothetical protein I5071_71370 [Sandaracinus amylolyticus]